MACRSGGFVDWGSAGIAIGEEMFDEALLLARCWDVACLEACSADLLRNISGQARLLLTLLCHRKQQILVTRNRPYQADSGSAV